MTFFLSVNKRLDLRFSENLFNSMRYVICIEKRGILFYTIKKYRCGLRNESFNIFQHIFNKYREKSQLYINTFSLACNARITLYEKIAIRFKLQRKHFEE